MQTVGMIGLGALGVLFGQRLMANGADVRVLADKARAEKYQKQGVTCNGAPVAFRYVTPEEAEPVDLMIFATKEGGLRGAMETAAGFIGENTLILSVLNGVSSEEILAERFGETNILYCTAQGMDAVKVGNALTYAHAGMIVLGEKLPGEITPRVGILHIDGFLRAGEHDGFAAVLNQIGKRAGCVGHRIRAVGDNKTVVSVVMIPQTFGQRQPAVRRHVGGINVHRLHCVNAAERTERGHAAQNIVGQKLRRQAVFRWTAGDGAAGCNQQNMLHQRHSL